MIDLKCSACGATSWPYAIAGGLCGWKLPSGRFCPGPIVDTREQARLERIQEQSRQLSLEECVYWLEVLRVSAINITVRDWSQGAIVCAILRDAPGVRYWSRGIGGGYPSKHSRERRELLALTLLCREARRRIKELQR